MKWFAGIRAVALLRRIALATEGIESQLRYRNEREFPPMKLTNGERKPTVISKTRRIDDAT